jgi:hypothetical protein
MTTLTFHHPSAFLWALLAVPLAMLYFRQVRPAVQPIGTGFLWQEVLGRPATAPWLLWRGPVSLGLALLVLLLLVLALADPSLRAARRTVLVVDNSASMNATDASPTRLDQARQWADRRAGELAAHEEAAILTAGDGVGACCGWSRRPEILRSAIRGIAATGGPSHVRQAVAIARELLAGDPQGRILVLSDGSFPGAVELAESDDVQWVSFGGRGDNVGITRLEARRNLSAPLCCQVLVEVTSYCDWPVTCPLQLFWDDEPLERRSIEIPAGGQWRQVFQTTRAEGGRLTARLDHPDCYLADNRATTVVPPCRRFQVFLAGDKNLYLEKALAANPRVAFGPGDRAAGDSAAAAVRVIYGPVPRTLPAGPLLVVNPQGPCDLWQPGDAIAEPVVARQAEGLPLLNEVRLVGIRLAGARKLLLRKPKCGTSVAAKLVRLAEARKLSLRPKAEPLAQPLAWAADGSPLAYAIPRAEGRVIVLAGSLEGGEWPQRTAFPILLANALDWVAFQGSRHTPCAAPDGTRRVPTTDTSDLRVPQRLAGKTVASEDREFPLWICLVGLAGLLLTAEWCLYHRRWTC